MLKIHVVDYLPNLLHEYWTMIAKKEQVFLPNDEEDDTDNNRLPEISSEIAEIARNTPFALLYITDSDNDPRLPNDTHATIVHIQSGIKQSVRLGITLRVALNNIKRILDNEKSRVGRGYFLCFNATMETSRTRPAILRVDKENKKQSICRCYWCGANASHKHRIDCKISLITEIVNKLKL